MSDEDEEQGGYESSASSASSNSSGSSSSGSTLFSDIEYAENLKEVDLMVSQKLQPEPPKEYDTNTVESTFAGITMKVMASDVQHIADQFLSGARSGCHESLDAHVKQYLQCQPVIFMGIRMTQSDSENIPPLGICGPLAGFATSSLPHHVRRCNQLDLDDHDTRAAFVEYLDDVLSSKYAHIDSTSRDTLMFKLRGIRRHINNGGSSSLPSSSGLWLDQFETHFLCSLKTPSVMWVQHISDETMLMLTTGTDKISKVSWSSSSIDQYFSGELSHFMLSSRHFGRVTFPFNKSDLQRELHTLTYRLMGEVKRYFESKALVLNYDPVQSGIVSPSSILPNTTTGAVVSGVPSPDENATPSPDEHATPAPDKSGVPDVIVSPSPDENATPSPDEHATPAPDENGTPDDNITPDPDESDVPHRVTENSTGGNNSPMTVAELNEEDSPLSPRFL